MAEGTHDHAYGDEVEVEIRGITFYASLFREVRHAEKGWLYDHDAAAVFMHLGQGIACVGSIKRDVSGHSAGKWRAADWQYFDHKGDDTIQGAIETLVYYEKRNKGRDLIRMAYGDEPYRGR